MLHMGSDQCVCAYYTHSSEVVVLSGQTLEEEREKKKRTKFNTQTHAPYLRFCFELSGIITLCKYKMFSIGHTCTVCAEM